MCEKKETETENKHSAKKLLTALVRTSKVVGSGGGQREQRLRGAGASKEAATAEAAAANVERY